MKKNVNYDYNYFIKFINDYDYNYFLKKYVDYKYDYNYFKICQLQFNGYLTYMS